MKAKLLTRINAFVAFLLTSLGFGSCSFMQKYGVPQPECLYGAPPAIEAKDSVADEEPLATDLQIHEQ